MDLEILQNKIDDLKAQRESANKKYEVYNAKEREKIAIKILAFVEEQLLAPLTITDKIGKYHIYETFNENIISYYNGIILDAHSHTCEVFGTANAKTYFNSKFLSSYSIEYLQKCYLNLVGFVKPRIDNIIQKYIEDYNAETLRLERVVLGGK